MGGTVGTAGAASLTPRRSSSARRWRNKGLINHGWNYINIDDGWQGVRGGEFNGIQGNQKFPDMKGLADSVHGLGLKIGIYSTPWGELRRAHRGIGRQRGGDVRLDMRAKGRGLPARGPEGRQGMGIRQHSFAVNDAQQWAAWGFDYLKYDWNPNDVPHVREMAEALRASGRDIALSLSNSAPFESAAELSALAHCWRTTGDIRDTWESMSRIGFSQDRWRPYARPGHWNDPDMLVVGLGRLGPAAAPHAPHARRTVHAHQPVVPARRAAADRLRPDAAR